MYMSMARIIKSATSRRVKNKLGMFGKLKQILTAKQND